MSKMTVNDFRQKEFYQLPKWILDVKGLQPADVLIYMLAINNWKLSEKNGMINENEEVYFYLTHETLKEKLDLGKNQIIYSLERLVENGLLVTEKQKGKATKFYLENDIKNINFGDSSLKKGSTKNKTRVVSNSDQCSLKKVSTNQSEKSDINKTDLLNKTEYKNELNNNTKKSTQEEVQDNLSWIPFKNQELKQVFETYFITMLKAQRHLGDIAVMQLLRLSSDEKELLEIVTNAVLGGYKTFRALEKPRGSYKKSVEKKEFKQTEYSKADDSWMDEILGEER